jgi:hypothetical protein
VAMILLLISTLSLLTLGRYRQTVVTAPVLA